MVLNENKKPEKNNKNDSSANWEAKTLIKEHSTKIKIKVALRFWDRIIEIAKNKVRLCCHWCALVLCYFYCVCTDWTFSRIYWSKLSKSKLICENTKSTRSKTKRDSWRWFCDFVAVIDFYFMNVIFVTCWNWLKNGLISNSIIWIVTRCKFNWIIRRTSRLLVRLTTNVERLIATSQRFGHLWRF